MLFRRVHEAILLVFSGKFLEDSNFGLAVIAAYTGMKGDSEKARVLTQARAVVIRDYLAQTFKLDDARVKTIGRGEARDADDTSEVEIIVYRVGADRPAAQN